MFASNWAVVEHRLSAVFTDELCSFSAKVFDLWHLEELVDSFGKAEFGVGNEVISRVSSDPNRQISDLPITSVFKSFSEPAVMAPTEEAA